MRFTDDFTNPFVPDCVPGRELTVGDFQKQGTSDRDGIKHPPGYNAPETVIVIDPKWIIEYEQ